MACLAELEASFVGDLGEPEVEVVREPSGGSADIGAREGVDRGDEARERLTDAVRQLRVDRLLLALDLGLEHLEPVPQRDDGAWLDEKRRAARARRVDDAGEAFVCVRTDGHDVATLALGDEAILEDRLVLRHQVFEPREHPLARCVELAAELLEPRARVIGEGAVRIERGRELVGERIERGVGRAGAVECRHA